MPKWKMKVWKPNPNWLVVTTIVEASKLGNCGVINKPSLPQNQGPSFCTKSRSFCVSKWTMKHPLEHRKISHYVVQELNTQWNKASSLGKEPLNLHMMAFDWRTKNRGEASKLLISMDGTCSILSTIYGHGIFWCSYAGAFTIPYAVALKDGARFLVLTLGVPPHSLVFRMIVELFVM